MIHSVRVPALAGVRHGFLGRTGGVSSEIYASLNTGVGSDDEATFVQENRARALAHVAPGAALVSLYQVHGCEVVTVDGPMADAERPKADAMVTATAGLALGILTADCAPVLLADVDAGVIGAAHAGWRGAVSGVLPATVQAMVALGAEPGRIVAAIGPCIARASYEVDAAFCQLLMGQDEDYGRFLVSGREGHYQFDLEGFAMASLAGAGLRTVIATGIDTYADPALWFSYRRTTHRGEPDYGRQISLIAL